MSYQNGTDITLLAAADLSSSQYLAVVLGTSGITVASAAGADVIGILQNDPPDGQAATVRVAGITKWIAGGTIARGARVASDAAGKAKTAVAGTVNTSDAGASGDPLVGSFSIGKALEAGVSGQVIAVLIDKAGLVPTTAA